MPAGRL